MLQTIFHSIQELSLMITIRESTLAYPIIMSTHLACIAAFGGMVFATNLRLLGWGFMDYSVTDVIKGLRPFKHAGMTLIIICGLLLWTSEADKYAYNPYFWTKIALLSLAIVHALYFRKSVYKNTEALDQATRMPGTAKTAAMISMFIWTALPCMGRLIAYWG